MITTIPQIHPSAVDMTSCLGNSFLLKSRNAYRLIHWTAVAEHRETRGQTRRRGQEVRRKKTLDTWRRSWYNTHRIDISSAAEAIRLTRIISTSFQQQRKNVVSCAKDGLVSTLEKSYDAVVFQLNSGVIVSGGFIGFRPEGQLI